MMKNWAYCLALLHPVSVGVGMWIGGGWIYSTIILSVVVYPLLEVLVKSKSSGVAAAAAASTVPDFIARLTALATICMVGALALRIPTSPFTGVEITVLVYSCGLTTGIVGIVLAHELFHRKAWCDRGLGITLMLLAGYPHFQLHHLYSHHPNVATDKDYSSARKGESVYYFYWKSIIGGGLEVARKEGGRSILRVGHPYHPIYNRALSLWLIQGCIYLAIYFWVGSSGLGLFIAQGLTSVMVLETVNYIQHYGLERKAESRRANYAISWDSYFITNYALFNLGFHSDHHVNPTKPFHSLAAIALIPPLWRGMMDERLLSLTAKTRC